ncbi:MAG: universal stress protein [Myxococcota bacterium]
MKTILIATDFSDHAQLAADTAIALARRHEANLVCVHATIMSEAEPTLFETAHGKLEEFRQHVQNQLGQRRAWLKMLSDRADNAGVRSQHHLVDGSPADAICAAADEVQADLVVMGSHGHTGFKRILLGSVAERVVRLCKSSVLIARGQRIDENGFRRIVVPTDFSASADTALERAVHLAAVDATVDILHCWQVLGYAEGPLDPSAGPAIIHTTIAEHVAKDAEKRGRVLVERASGGERTVCFHVHRGRPTAGIQSFLDEQAQPCDLLAVGTHGRTGLSRLLLGSVAETTVRYSPCSVLVARS